MALSSIDNDIITQDDVEEEDKVEGGGTLDIETIITSENLCDELSDDYLNSLGKDVVKNFQYDEDARDEWKTKVEKAIKFAKLKPDARPLPFRNAADLCYPLIAMAAIQFSARALPSLIRDGKLVKGKYSPTVKVPVAMPPVHPEMAEQLQANPQAQQQFAALAEQLAEANYKNILREKALSADRVGDHMSWQLLDQSNDWLEQMDQMLTELPIAGSGFKKVWYDQSIGQTRYDYISALNFSVDPNCKNIAESSRHTEIFILYPNKYETRIREGIYRRVDLKGTEGMAEDASTDSVKKDPNPEDKSDPYIFLDQYCWLDIDDDGLEEPYIVTVHKATEKVVRIKANFSIEGVLAKEDGTIVEIKPYNKFTRYLFFPDPEGNFYGMGFGTLELPLNEIINAVLNELIDAGHLANIKSGVFDSKLEFYEQNSNLKFEMAEFKPVDFDGDNINNSIMVFPFGEPSVVLFQILGFMVEAAEKLASVTNVLAGESPGSNVPATTTLAIIEQGMKVYSSIYSRLHRSLKSELQAIYACNRLYADTMEEFIIYGAAGEGVAKGDYFRITEGDIIPISDPNTATDMQLLARVNALLPLVGSGKVDDNEVIREYLRSLKVGDIERFMPKEQSPDPKVVFEIEKLKLEEKKHLLELFRAADEHIKTMAEINKMSAESVKAIADAESKEEGKQLDEYMNKYNQISEENETLKSSMENRDYLNKIQSDIVQRLLNGQQQQPGVEGNEPVAVPDMAGVAGNAEVPSRTVAAEETV